MVAKLEGKRFGRLVAEKPVGKSPTGHILWQLKCDCGNVIERGTGQLKRLQSCGCLAHDVTVERSTTHGQSRIDDPTYKVWVQMRRRCRERLEYAGRGIKVCARWDDFANFLADMGPKPAGMQIDRIDNDGNYEPSNCRWATPKVNSNNRRNSVMITHKGRTQSAAEWSDELGIPNQTIRWRVAQGWSSEDALRR